MDFAQFITIILIAVSLSIDTLVVTICGSLNLGKTTLSQTLKIAAVFALTQTAFIFGGWALGYSVVEFVEKWAPYIAFGLLLYIGGNMIIDAIKKFIAEAKGKNDDDQEATINLSGLKNLFLAGVATSIDAVAVGVSMAMDKTPLLRMTYNIIIVFVITTLFAITGITCGRIIGTKFGKTASIFGGLTLIGIGIWCLLK